MALRWLWVALPRLSAFCLLVLRSSIAEGGLPSSFSQARGRNHERPEMPEIADILPNGGAHRAGEQCSSCKPFIFRVLPGFRGLARCSCVHWIALLGLGTRPVCWK